MLSPVVSKYCFVNNKFVSWQYEDSKRQALTSFTQVMWQSWKLITGLKQENGIMSILVILKLYRLIIVQTKQVNFQPVCYGIIRS